jgi:hypothetical protein
MKLNDLLFNIEPLFVGPGESLHQECYTKIVRGSLDMILAERTDIKQNFEGVEDPVNAAELRDAYLSHLPLVTATKCLELPGTMSFFALTLERSNAFKFFYEMINSWLIPGRRLNVILTHSVDFRLPALGDEVYILCEMMVRVENERQLEQILDNLPAIETEIEMGLASSYYAKRILEIKGFSADEKTAAIQEDIAYLIDHFPNDFDQDALTEMQHVLLICREEFKAVRECRHLSRIIGIHYFFRRRLLEAVKNAPEKRHLSLKLFRARLKLEEGHKNVIGVLVGVNFFKDREIFDKVHLITAIQSYIPTARPIENSFFANRHGSESVCTFYIEMEKNDNEAFTAKEIKLLREQLPNDLKVRIKHFLQPVFMPQNEEEVIRNILSLSSQIKYIRDIPQVFITFDEQTHSHLFFTIALVRILKIDSLPIQEMFKKSGTFLAYIHDRCQAVGSLRRKHKKEATVFRTKLTKDAFIRADHTIDINKARQAVVSELFKIIGDIRDYNGGMISKQNEVLDDLKMHLKDTIRYNELLLEDFFYSLTPVIMRNVLEIEPLGTLYLMLLNAVEDFNQERNYSLKISSDHQFVFVMIKADDRALKEDITKAIGKLQLHSSQLASAFVTVYEEIYLGYIYRTDDPEKRQKFSLAIQQALTNWNLKKVRAYLPL